MVHQIIKHMRYLFALVLLFGLSLNAASAQKYITKTGYINFFSEAPLENIEATSNQVLSVLNAADGAIVFKVQIMTFQFEKALMQEHFNEKYMESEQYPDAVFKGNITNISAVNFSKDGTYNVKVTGKLTMHGVTNDVTTDATITVKGGAVSAEAVFPVTLADYNIKIPGAVKDNIAETVEVTVKASYNKM